MKIYAVVYNTSAGHISYILKAFIYRPSAIKFLTNCRIDVAEPDRYSLEIIEVEQE